MKPADTSAVSVLYEDSADSYSSMMDAEILSPIYTDTLDRLHERLAGLPGVLIDTSCGSGHMLALYAERFVDSRELIGVDLTPRMVEIAREKLGPAASVIVGDMRSLPLRADESAAAILSYFALHHLDIAGVDAAFDEWHRVLKPGGQLVIAAWEGAGAIDYGENSDIIALKHDGNELSSRLEAAGFSVDQIKIEIVEDMNMDAIYLEATRA